MNNFELIKNMKDAEELGKFLCNEWEQSVISRDEDSYCCEGCPATEKCGKGHNGFVAWLKEETNGTKQAQK